MKFNLKFSLKNSFFPSFLAPFLIIILSEFLIIYGLNFYIQKLNNEMTNIKENLEVKENNLSEKLTSLEAFSAFSQIVNVIEILKTKKRVNAVIDKFNQIMPKSLIIESFDYDSENNEISLKALVPNLFEYIRFYYYIKNHSLFSLKNNPFPIFTNKGISFELVISLNTAFYQ